MFSYDFKSYCLDMPLFKSDVNWYYVSKIQLLDFYSHIHNDRVSEDNTESEKKKKRKTKLYKIISKKWKGKDEHHIVFVPGVLTVHFLEQ